MLVTNEEEISALNGKVVQLTEESSLLKAQMQKDVESLSALKSIRARSAALEDEIKGKDQKVSELEERLLESEAALESRKKTEEALRGELSSREQRLSALEDEIKGKGQKVSELEERLLKSDAALEARKKTEETLRADLSSGDRKLSELGNQIKGKEQRISEFEDKLRESEGSLAEEKKIQERLRAELSSKAKMVEELQGELKLSLSRLLSIEDESAKGKAEKEVLKRRLSQINGEKIQAEEKLGQLKSTYESLLSDLKTQIEKKEVAIKAFEEKISLTFVDRILFQVGEAAITPSGREVLRDLGKGLRNVKFKQIRVEGHTDNTPIRPGSGLGFPSNWELSTARAAAVVRYLQNEVGLDPANLEAVGYAFYRPVAGNDTEEGRALNRRVNIVIAPKLE